MNIKLSNHLAVVLSTAVLLGASGCAIEGIGGGDYSRTQTRGEQAVFMGEVISVRIVRIEGTRSGIGSMAGAGLGAVAGSGIGRGRGSLAAGIGGAIVGGLIGQAVEQMATKEYGLEITIELDSRRVIAVTQGNDEQFRVGDRVRVLRGSGETRVSH